MREILANAHVRVDHSLTGIRILVRVFDDLVARDKTSLDLFWLRNENLEDSDNLPAPGILAAEIVEDLEAALEQFREIAEDLGGEGRGRLIGGGCGTGSLLIQRISRANGLALPPPVAFSPHTERKRCPMRRVVTRMAPRNSTPEEENVMGEAGIVFDHVHLISADPQAAASWYMDKLGGKIVGQSDTGGARQFLVAFDGATLIVRGQREREQASTKSSLHWGTDHFGFRVKGDFDEFCGELKKRGVEFTLDPVDFTPSVRIAFITGPDNVNIELLQRKV